jgi:uncharacterized protein (DUF305 family)
MARWRAAGILVRMRKTTTAIAALLSLGLALTGCAPAAEPTASPSATQSMVNEADRRDYAVNMIPLMLQQMTLSAFSKNNTKNDELLGLAEQIYTELAGEVETLKTWLGETVIEDGATTDGMLSYEAMTAINDLRDAKFDTAFKDAMIDLHTLSMTLSADPRKSEDSTLQQFATKLVTAQVVELSLLKLIK